MEAPPKNRAFGPGARLQRSSSDQDGAVSSVLARNNEVIHVPGPPQTPRSPSDHGAPIPSAQPSLSGKDGQAHQETFHNHLAHSARGAPKEWLWSTLPADLAGPHSQREPRFVPEVDIGTVPWPSTQQDTFEIASPRCSGDLGAITGEYHISGHAFSDGEPDESWDEFKNRLADSIRQMMYVSGETAEPPVETTSIIEDIVRQQVIELLRNCTELASRRGSKSIGINDLIFQIRHDQAKVSRLRTFLSWKDVRKNVKDSDDKGADADLAGGEDPVEGTAGNDEAAKKNKKAKVGLPWEPSSFYAVEVPERDDEEDEEEEEMNYITLQRLRKADERTKAMTKEEYVTWSEYRQASFTYRKGKRFREWAGFGIVTDSKPSDDIVDILGFLTFEMVQTLTEMALKVKEQEDMARAQNGGDKDGTTKKRKHEQALFDPPSEGKTPIEPRHVQEGSRRLQQRPKKSRAMLNGTKLPQHTPLNIF